MANKLFKAGVQYKIFKDEDRVRLINIRILIRLDSVFFKSSAPYFQIENVTNTLALIVLSKKAEIIRNGVVVDTVSYGLADNTIKSTDFSITLQNEDQLQVTIETNNSTSSLKEYIGNSNVGEIQDSIFQINLIPFGLNETLDENINPIYLLDLESIDFVNNILTLGVVFTNTKENNLLTTPFKVTIPKSNSLITAKTLAELSDINSLFSGDVIYIHGFITDIFHEYKTGLRSLGFDVTDPVLENMLYCNFSSSDIGKVYVFESFTNEPGIYINDSILSSVLLHSQSTADLEASVV